VTLDRSNGNEKSGSDLSIRQVIADSRQYLSFACRHTHLGGPDGFATFKLCIL
jgi:hypothetical protein